MCDYPHEHCADCGRIDTKLHPYWEWFLCTECLEIARENDRINQEDEIREDARLFKQ